MWCFKNANFSAFSEIHSLFLGDFSESKFLIKGFLSKKKNCIRIQGLPIVLRRPLLPNFARGSSKTQSTIKITYSCTAGECGGNRIKFSWSMAAGARYILLANDILTVCMVNPIFFWRDVTQHTIMDLNFYGKRILSNGNHSKCYFKYWVHSQRVCCT